MTEVFFYGSFINVDVLASYHVHPLDVEVATLDGFDISIAPHATLVPRKGASVYGIVCSMTQRELDGLYGEEWVAGYVPEAVVVETLGGRPVAALCYIAPADNPQPATNEYIDRITSAARKLDFPPAYIERLEAWRP